MEYVPLWGTVQWDTSLEWRLVDQPLNLRVAIILSTAHCRPCTSCFLDVSLMGCVKFHCFAFTCWIATKLSCPIGRPCRRLFLCLMTSDRLQIAIAGTGEALNRRTVEVCTFGFNISCDPAVTAVHTNDCSVDCGFFLGRYPINGHIQFWVTLVVLMYGKPHFDDQGRWVEQSGLQCRRFHHDLSCASNVCKLIRIEQIYWNGSVQPVVVPRQFCRFGDGRHTM